MNTTTETAVRGAVAGAAGTAAMTMMMRGVAPRVVPEEMRPDEFVPKKIVEWAEEQAGAPDALPDDAELKLSMVPHFGYGSGMGALYGLARDRVDGVPAPLAGALFGVAVWAIGFEGWLPALGVQPATTEQPPRKRPMPIMAHLVYGVTTAMAYEALEGV